MASAVTGTGKCPVCKSPTLPNVLSAADYMSGTEFALHQCTQCKVIFTEPPKDLGSYYAPQYRQYSGITLKVLRSLYDWRVQSWTRLFPVSGVALEVGCGSGHMLQALQRRGWRVFGLERSAAVLAVAHADFDLPVFAGDLEAIRPTAKFDLIILFQVLEHLSDPATVLMRCSQLLKPQGKLVIGVPNLASWQARFSGRWWLHLDVPRHLFHFSPESLESALRLADMRVASIRYASWEHDPYGWVQSLLNRMGFEQNMLTKILMGIKPRTSSSLTKAAMAATALVLGPPSVLLALFSWMFKAGAIMEVQAVKTSEKP